MKSNCELPVNCGVFDVYSLLHSCFLKKVLRGRYVGSFGKRDRSFLLAHDALFALLYKRINSTLWPLLSLRCGFLGARS